MKATEASLLNFLKKSPQFAIPIYQRAYSWTERECEQLWDDITRAGTNDSISAHFIGSIVYVEDGLYQISNQSPLLVIDGQQRLTTITLLIEALARVLGDSEPVDGFSAMKLRNYYLLNPYESGERHYKLLLSETDKDTLTAIIKQQPVPNGHSLRLKGNFDFFTERLRKDKTNFTAICKGLGKLVVVDIALDRDQDNPQLIFESLNSTGKELSQADLIRNYVLMGLESELQTRLYKDYWRPMELEFGQEAYVTDFDKFMRHYLTVKTGDIPKVGGVYEAFKRYSSIPRSGRVDLEPLVADIQKYASYYCAIAFGTEPDKKLKQAFNYIRELKVEVAYPLLIELYNDYMESGLIKSDFIAIIELIEAYVFRRAVCSIPTNSMNKTFATFTRSLDKNKYLESVQAHFLLLPSYRRFPNDQEFKRELKTRDLYNFRNRSYWLRRLENHGRKEQVPVDEYTVEHIMPQNRNLSAAWQTELGADWEQVQEKWLHTLGNLTLSGYNSEYSDRPFQEKRDMEGGFKESPLRLNQGLGAVDTWNEHAIFTRANHLAKHASQVWVAPELSVDVLQLYKPSAPPLAYSINDHPYIAPGGPMGELFQAFRKEILALDPCVTEEYLKLYIAYKAETNFVDVVPQAKRLRLSLNMPFSEINDSRKICKNVSELGRWGNGEVEIGLNSIEELPYVIGLVRQSLERQLGDG